MTNRMWVTLLYLLARQSHQLCFILCPTGCEWHCFLSLPGSLMNHVSSHDQQEVSDTALFLCQAVSSIMFHPMTNRKWVTLLYFFARQSINHVSSHDQQRVSDTTLFICQAVSSIMLYPMTNRQWVALLYFFARQSQQSSFILWPTASEWYCFISLLGSLINDVLSHDQQEVSDTALFLCQAISAIMFHPMANR